MAKERKKKNVALVFGITKDYTFALANTLIGLKKHNKKFWDDIIVYHDGIPEYEQKAINEIVKIRFVDLSRYEHFKRIANGNTNVLKKYSIATFYRYECLTLLDEYHRVIWNDVDVLIQGDISELLEYGKESGLAFSRALPNFVVGSSFKKLLKDYRMFAPLWNVGIMVLTDKLKKHREMYEWCIEATNEYEDILLWPDLAILNLMIQKFGIEPDNIDGDKYVCLPTLDCVSDARIVHAYGDKKFWNDLEYMERFPEWIEYAIKWSKISYNETKNNKPLVSCVMSCYERYDYLLQSINSILAQTYTNIEIIVVVEKSKTQEEIANFLKDLGDSRIKIINNKTKLGFAASLNVGIDAAKGEYIARLDDDDIAMLQRFDMQVRYMEEHKDIGIVGGNMIVFGSNKGRFLTFKDHNYLKALTLIGTPFLHPTVMMRKTMLDEYGLRYDPDYFTEDYELWSRAVYCFKCANLPEYLTFYRSHEKQATGNNNDVKIHNSHKKIMKNQLKKYLDLDFTDNEIETIQVRKNCFESIEDLSSAFAMRENTIDRIIESNNKRHAYNKEALRYVINWGKPNDINGGTEYDIKRKQKGIKKRLKKLIKPIINPVYGRLVGKMETMMMNHDEELRINLQEQINKINGDKSDS